MMYVGKTQINRSIALIAALFSLQANSVFAEDVTSEITSQTTAAYQSTNSDEFSDANLVASDSLNEKRGTGSEEETTINLANIKAYNNNNTYENTVTGTNSLAEGAVAVNGINTTIQNSGNGAQIQAATIVNIKVCGGTC